MMKQQAFVCTILISFFSIALMGQTYIMPKIGYGLSGFASSNLSSTNYDAQTKSGMVAGLAIDITIGNGLSVQPELLYVQKGANEVSEISAGYFDEVDVPNIGLVEVYDNYDWTLNYIEVPILLKYTFLSSGVGGHVMAGPSFSMGIGGELDFTLTDVETDDRWDSSVDSYNTYAGLVDTPIDVGFGSSDGDDFKSIDIGIAVGAGLYIDAGSGKLNLDVRYVQGLMNAINTTGDDFVSKNTSLQISLGYAFPIGG